uniref:Uncharacterized protein n=1 Tax=Timema douglasi TaxID=61478 RepID=A0A7R8ZD36_TIMDO|nr:unnamed protein product [Timema douglasi]
MLGVGQPWWLLVLEDSIVITLSSSEDEDNDRSNCKDSFTTKQDANTFQNNNLDSAVAVSAHKKEPKDDSDREIVNERISKRTIGPLYPSSALAQAAPTNLPTAQTAPQSMSHP